MKPLLHDLQLLQSDGITLHMNECINIVKGKLISISADNLSAHALAGFQVYFHTGRICRFCMTDKKDLVTTLTEQSCIIRTPELHKYHIDAVTQNASNGSIYGVTKDCTFNELPGFSVLHAFPPDIMHDLVEGTMPVITLLVLKHLQRRAVMSLSALNKAISTASLSRPENRPCLLTESAMKASGHVTDTAAQKIELFLLLPQLIGSNVPEDDEAWQTYLLLRNICDIAFAPVIEQESVVELVDLVSQFISSVVRVFGAEYVTPKMHFMLHYPRLIKLLGPLRNYWFMRFEAKHQYFKKIAARTKCFKNITKTLSKWSVCSTGCRRGESASFHSYKVYSLLKNKLSVGWASAYSQ